MRGQEYGRVSQGVTLRTIAKLHRSMVIASMIGIGSIVFATTETSANPLCGNRTDMLAKLAKEFGEAPSALGLASNGGVVEQLSSESGSWTLMITFAPPAGSTAGSCTCLIATGEGWQATEPQKQVAGWPT